MVARRNSFHKMLAWLSHVGRSRTLQNAVNSVNVVESRRRGACNDPVKRVKRKRLKYHSACMLCHG